MDTELKISGLESIQQNLMQNGFKKDGDNFIKETIQKQMMVINGQDCSKELKQRVVIEYLGEGWREEKDGQQKLYGFSIKPNGKTSTLDIWASCWEEFCELTI